MQSCAPNNRPTTFALNFLFLIIILRYTCVPTRPQDQSLFWSCRIFAIKFTMQRTYFPSFPWSKTPKRQHIHCLKKNFYQKSKTTKTHLCFCAKDHRHKNISTLLTERNAPCTLWQPSLMIISVTEHLKIWSISVKAFSHRENWQILTSCPKTSTCHSVWEPDDVWSSITARKAKLSYDALWTQSWVIAGKTEDDRSHLRAKCWPVKASCNSKSHMVYSILSQ